MSKRSGRGRHGHAGPPHRARRGAVAQAILLLLSERPMHGYELIEELETRSQGAWRPSPGSIYPALRRMEARGLVVGADDEQSKRVYSITEDGYQRVADRDPEAPPPWEHFADRGPSLRPLAMELMSQVRQIGRFGSSEQRQQAADILTQAKADLYGVMATAQPDAEPSADADPADEGDDAPEA